MNTQKTISVAELDRILARHPVTNTTIWLRAKVADHHAKNG